MLCRLLHRLTNRLALSAQVAGVGVLIGAGANASAAPFEQDAQGLAIDAAKVLTCADADGGYLNRGRVLVQGGRILAVGRQSELEIPKGFEHRDFGDLWLMPGMIDLHSHIGGTFDINGAVYQANPGLRVSTAVIPGNSAFRRALAAGVTTVRSPADLGNAIQDKLGN